MLKLIEWACFCAGMASIGAPLLYAVATLEGMQRKTIRPIFGAWNDMDNNPV